MEEEVRFNHSFMTKFRGPSENFDSLPLQVPIEGQRAFVQLRRTLEFVSWKGADISVLDRILVKAPYTVDSLQLVHVRALCKR